MKNKNNYSNSGNIRTIKSVMTGVFCGISICVLFLIFMAFLITKSNNFPHTIIPPLMIIIAGIGAFAGGYISARISSEKGMMCGMICAFLMFILLFIAGLISVREAITMMTVIRLLAMLLTGAIGGIIGVNKRKRA